MQSGGSAEELQRGLVAFSNRNSCASAGSLNNKDSRGSFKAKVLSMQRKRTRSLKHARSLFSNDADIKAKLQQSCAKRAYDVFDKYKHEGRAQAIAKHPFFEYATLLVISINSIW